MARTGQAPRLWLAISGHGYGHAAQAGPLVAALRREWPDLELVVESALPRTLLEQRFIGAPFRHVARRVDPGMLMHDALRVDAAGSRAAYARWHRGWSARLRRAAADLREARPDLLLADVPYLPLAAAAAAGIPAVAVCSLNWADIYRAVCLGSAPPDAVWRRMHAAYAGAARFYRPAPAMPMPTLANTCAVGPLAARGRPRRAELLGRLGLDSGTRLVLVALGGLPARLPLECWPKAAGVHYLVPGGWGVARADAHPVEPLGWPFLDLLASCDALLAKPGYGLFVEAACHAIPVAVVPRLDWPESACLVDWLAANGRMAGLAAAQLADGTGIAALLQQLWSRPAPPPPRADGAVQIAADLRRWLRA